MTDTPDAWYAVYRKHVESKNTVSKILPCPFCGSTELWSMDSRDAGEDYICCKTCRASGPETYDENEAISRWNAAPRHIKAYDRIIESDPNKVEAQDPRWPICRCTKPCRCINAQYRKP